MLTFASVRQIVAGLAAGQSRRVGVLVDGDNTPPRAGEALFSYARTLGRISYSEVFANFAGGGTAGWAPQIRKHGLAARQQFNTSRGKNGTDVALALAAVDLAHKRSIDTYVIATSDADLSAVAHRLRQSGASVHGIGSSHAATAFRQACDTFVAIEDLPHVVRAQAGQRTLPADLWRRQPDEAEDHILLALVRLGGARDWVEVSRLGEELSKSYGRFDPRAFSRRSLPCLLDALDSVTVDQTSNPRRVRMALQPSARNG